MITNELTEIFADAPFGIWTALMIRITGNTRHDASLIVGFAQALGMDATEVAYQIQANLHAANEWLH
jgi:hypothetical protein